MVATISSPCFHSSGNCANLVSFGLVSQIAAIDRIMLPIRGFFAGSVMMIGISCFIDGVVGQILEVSHWVNLRSSLESSLNFSNRLGDKGKMIGPERVAFTTKYVVGPAK